MATGSLPQWLRRLTPDRRASEIEYLKDSVRLLRRFADGWTAADGYDLHYVTSWNAAKAAKVRKYAAILRREISQESYRIVRPRSARSRKALRLETGQTAVPKRRAFVVHVPHANQRVRVVTTSRKIKGKIVKKSNVEIRDRVGKQIYRNRFFRFERQPFTFDDIIRETRKMLKFMPRGWYVIQTSNYQSIGVPIRKDDLLSELQSRYVIYDKLPESGEKDSRGLAETVIGFMLIGYREIDAERFDVGRLTRMETARKFRAKQRAARRRALLKRRGIRK